MPLSSLRQCFLNGTLTRLLDPDMVLRSKIAEFVARGDFGLASGPRPDGTYARVWHSELVPADEVAFDPGVALLMKERAKLLKGETKAEPVGGPPLGVQPTPQPELELVPPPGPEALPAARMMTLRLVGTVPPEVWNRLGTRLLPKLRSGADLKVGVDFSVTLDAQLARNLEADLRQALADLGLADRVRIERQ